MKKGDILLVHYRFDPIGYIIRKATKSEWNHVAWAISSKRLIQACRKGIITVPLSKYLNKTLYRVKLLRIDNISQKKLDRAIKLTINMKSKGNYFKLLLSFVFVFRQESKKILRTTCSGLIAYCLSIVEWYFNKRKSPLLITPEDINCSKMRLKDVTKEI